jgi:hypothetical protein
MRRKPFGARAAALVFVVLATPALAETPVCSGASYGDTPSLQVFRVKAGVDKLHFLGQGGGNVACPSAAPECLDKAYLVAGDLVALGAKFGDYVCADFQSPRTTRVGWLLAAALESAPLIGDRAQWQGDWKRIEATIRIVASGEKLQAKGDATFGALDPDRVKRGAVNMGEFAGSLLMKDGLASYAETEFDPKDSEDLENPEASCHLRFARAGDLLIVQDNMKCGGMNVSFSGVYSRKK